MRLCILGTQGTRPEEHGMEGTLEYEATTFEREYLEDLQELMEGARPGFLAPAPPVWGQRLVRVWAPVEQGAERTVPTWVYQSPLGPLGIRCTERGLEALWFLARGEPGEDPWEGCDHWGDAQAVDPATIEDPVLADVVAWLDTYCAGADPGFTPALDLVGTPFQQEVWEELLAIPYGETRTYGDIARTLAERRGIPRMAAQAVGQALGRNPVCIVVPCHRVLGSHGDITGYSGGLAHKRALLTLEGTAFREGRLWRPRRVSGAEAPEAVGS